MTSSSMMAVFTSLIVEKRENNFGDNPTLGMNVCFFFYIFGITFITHLGIVWIMKMVCPRTDSFTSTRVSEWRGKIISTL